MKYLSTTEVSKKWGIGRRRIEILCASDRVPGAALVGNTWIIPEDAEKPEDKRVKNGRYIKNRQRNKCLGPLSGTSPVHVMNGTT